MEYIFAALLVISTGVSAAALLWARRAVRSAKEATDKAMAAAAAARSATEAAAALERTVRSELLPAESAARKAKEEIDRFNAGVYNILTYNGRKRRTSE